MFKQFSKINKNAKSRNQNKLKGPYLENEPKICIVLNQNEMK